MAGHCCAECHYAEYHHAECRYAEYHHAECPYAEYRYAEYRIPASGLNCKPFLPIAKL
jgi:hypothetical protein